ncbi:unnamed protein product [Caenorhabditis brenneri]
MDNSSERNSPQERVEISLSQPAMEKNEKEVSMKKSRHRRKSDGYKSFPQNQCPTKCKICNSPAIGYHYEVPSCNGCKIFFRRAILNGRKLKCSKINKCLDSQVVIEDTERVCRACRLKKCIEAGMNPLSIRAEVKSKEGKALRDELFKQMEQQNSKTVISSLIVAEEDITNRMIMKLTEIENRVEPLHRSGVPPGYRDVRKLEEIIASKPIFFISDIPNLTFCPHPCYADEKSSKRSTNYTHSSFLASIELSKLFDFSSQLDLDSKVLLIKHTTVGCSNLMDAFFSMNDMKSEVLLNPDGKPYGGETRNIKRFHLFQNTLAAFIDHQIDRVEYVLFKAIMLCNPAIPGLTVSDQQVLEKERNQFMKTLLNYCLIQHGKLHGPSRFLTILAMASTIETQSKNQKDLHLYSDAEHYQLHRSLGQIVRKCSSDSYDGILES